MPEARFFSLYRAKKERRKIDMILQRSFLLSLFVFLSEDSLKESLLLYRNLKSASGALDLGNVDAADYHLDFLLYGKNFKYIGVAGEGHNLRSYLGLDDGKLVPAEPSRRLLYHLGRQA